MNNKTTTTYFWPCAWHISYHWLFVVESHSTSVLSVWCPAAICTAACLFCSAPSFSAIWLDATEVVAMGGGIWEAVFPLDSTARHFCSYYRQKVNNNSVHYSPFYNDCRVLQSNVMQTLYTTLLQSSDLRTTVPLSIKFLLSSSPLLL